MAVAIAAVLCVALRRAASSQSADDSVATHRARFDAIERNRPRYRVAQASRKDLDLYGGVDVTPIDGSVTAYCDGSDIRLIVTNDYRVSGGEVPAFDRWIQSYYFDHDSLFFSYLKSGSVMRGEDTSSQKMQWRHEGRAYFTDGKLIRLLGDSPDGEVKNIPEELTSLYAKLHAADLLAEAGVYHGLMTGCVPRVIVLTDTNSVAKHRALFREIEHNKPRYRSATATREELGLPYRWSLQGAGMESYCDGKDIPLIVVEGDSHFPKMKRSYYFDHDTLFFAFFRIGYGPGDRGEVREWDEERLYFTNGKLARWLGKENEPHDVTTPQAHNRATEVLGQGRDYQQLMAQCTPHPREQ